MRVRVAPVSQVISLDNLQAPYDATINKTPLYFTYSLAQVEALENHLLLLNVSNRTRLQVYVHLHPFPDHTYHHYPLGDVPDKALKALFKNTGKMEVFEDSTAYIYDRESDTIVYPGTFGHLNPEAILPEAEEWIDGLKIAKVTTWTPESGPEVNAAGFNTDGRPLEDRIDFVFWAKMWLCNPVVHISVFNSHPEDGPVDF